MSVVFLWYVDDFAVVHVMVGYVEFVSKTQYALPFRGDRLETRWPSRSLWHGVCLTLVTNIHTPRASSERWMLDQYLLKRTETFSVKSASCPHDFFAQWDTAVMTKLHPSVGLYGLPNTAEMF